MGKGALGTFGLEACSDGEQFTSVASLICWRYTLKIALDPRMLRDQSITGWFKAAAETGYSFIELSPRDDFLPSHQGRRASREIVQAALEASRDTGVAIASIWTNHAWSSPDEGERRQAVYYWRQVFDVADELGCRHLNTEFKGDPLRPLLSEGAFWRSMEEVMPELEKRDLQLFIEPHPYDFVESGFRAVDLIRGLRSSHVGYIYCAPHTFCLGGELTELVRYAQEVLGHVHVADSYRSSRIIVDPHDAAVRVHQHLDLDQGEVDWHLLFETLKEIHFDGVLTVSVFAWPDRAIESFRYNRERVSYYLASVGWELADKPSEGADIVGSLSGSEAYPA